MTAASTFVLVHGGFVGGWYWRPVADILRQQGHRVFAPSLTGCADRSHLLSPDIDVTTHVMDVANLIAWEELSDIVLVGHSYGGMVISGIADAVPEGAIRSIVYLDALYLDDGESMADHAPGFREAVGDHDPIPVPPIETFGSHELNEAQLESAVRRQTPQPAATLLKPASVGGARDKVPNKTFIWARNSGIEAFEQCYKRLRDKSDWHTEIVEHGHELPLSVPEEVAQILLNAAR
ncbi:alpha/beta fold hydrolase [Parasphingopyxis marina]|uniref:Alpha/beta hydrolase n=1 Tax=Parasphingopyxis marina TaxID=2761622 RepID=A0A842HY65_9SPHN|nr:alpha/beta hydrolase [Parasphingopyxis marina]MBC2778046.1 alpha/beta hydrolase [Parasphingopyxis marina]